MNCLICYLEIKDKISLKLSCGHIFHKYCLEESCKYNDSTCPYCRKSFPLISNYSQIQQDILRYNKRTRRSKCVNILGLTTRILNIEKYIDKIIPHCWINGLYKDCFIPLYEIDIQGERYLVSLYLRLLLINDISNLINLKKLNDIKGKLDLDTNEKIILKDNRVLNKNEFLICYEWIYNILHDLKEEYNFVYYNYVNTLIFDFFLECIKKEYVNKTKYTYVLFASIYKTLSIINKNINLDNLLNTLIYNYSEDISKKDVFIYLKYIDKYILDFNIY